MGESCGFGPIGFAAPVRQELLADHTLRQGHDGALRIPIELNPEFFQSAPQRQRIDALAHDATITLEGMQKRGELNG